MKSVKLDIEVPSDFNEEWKRCPTFPPYEASNYGRVRRFGKAKGTTLQQRIIEQGYAVVTISIKAKVMVRMVHVMVLDAFLGPKPYQHFVQHIDGDKLNNTLANLRYVPGISSSGNIANNIANSSFNYLPEGHHWAITEKGMPRFSAPSLEQLLEAVRGATEEPEVSIADAVAIGITGGASLVAPQPDEISDLFDFD